jgi:hypothetical protein
MRFPADWRANGLDAPRLRNEQMFLHGDPDLVLAFPGGPNCNDIVRRARFAAVPVIAIEGDDWMTALQNDTAQRVRARA